MSTLQTAADEKTFALSRTCLALQSAALGEQHARRLYLHCARQMEAASLYVIAHAFRFTAAQEKEHADVLHGLIAAYGASATPAAEESPITLPQDPQMMLDAVIRAERNEADVLYPFNARIAMDEGYPRIAGAFHRIAENEQLHARRFQQYMTALHESTLFRDDSRLSWLCLSCGQLHTGQEAPELCAACGKDRGHFIRSSYFPFLVEG